MPPIDCLMWSFIIWKSSEIRISWLLKGGRSSGDLRDIVQERVGEYLTGKIDWVLQQPSRMGPAGQNRPPTESQ
jgi:hypothetical protein